MTVERALDGGAGSHVAPMPTPIERRGEMRRRCALADGLAQGSDAAWRRQPRRSLAGTRYLSQ
jgi:hypothetical protein